MGAGISGFSGGSEVKASAFNAGDLGSIPGVFRKIPWRRKWQPTPVLLPGESHEWRSLVGYSPLGRRVGHNWATSLSHLVKSRKTYGRRQWHPTPVLLPGKSHRWRSLVGCSPWGRRVGHNWATSLSLFTFMHWRRKWQPTPVFLPGESQGWGSLVGCHLWGLTESDTTEAT